MFMVLELYTVMCCLVLILSFSLKDCASFYFLWHLSRQEETLKVKKLMEKNMQRIEWNIYLHVSWKALRLDWLNTRLRAERVKDIWSFRNFWQNLELLSLWFETLRFQILKWWNLFLWNNSICNNSLHQFYETNKITSHIYFKD